MGSRADSLGLFWQDDIVASSNSKRDRPLPPVPETSWETPRGFPRLDKARIIGFDIETYDPRLRELGPGYVRKGENGERFDGWICGVSIATEDRAWYFPVRHPDSINVDKAALFAWLSDTLGTRRCAKVGANVAYDLGWLQAEGVQVKGAVLDVQYAEPLLNENAYTFELDALARKYLGTRKVTSELYRWCHQAFGGSIDDQRMNIWRAPASLVGPYAEGDAMLPLRIIAKQVAQLRKEGLYELFLLETSLTPLLLEMYKRGVYVDTSKAEQVKTQIRTAQEEAQRELETLTGFDISVNRGQDLVDAFDKFGIVYPRTQKGAPSFRKQWLQSVPHRLAELVLEVRKLDKAVGTFVESYILGHAVDNVIHASFHPLRTDHNGTVSGRFACSGPNLQNIPARDKRLAPLIRSMFVPAPGHPYWRRFDYSQIEYRFLAHFAVGAGSDEVRRRYNEDPDVDFHAMVTKLIHDVARMQLERDATKNVNFGLVYGMAEGTLRSFLGLDEQAAAEVFRAYHTGAPFVQKTYSYFERVARAEHHVSTILGRKRRFDLYEPAVSGVYGDPLPRRLAIERWGHVKPSGTHKALNAVLQGSAADIMKQGMADAYYAGVFDVVGVPHVTVHDELGCSDDGSPRHEEAYAELAHILETCIPLSVPVRVSVSRGATWGDAK